MSEERIGSCGAVHPEGAWCNLEARHPPPHWDVFRGARGVTWNDGDEALTFVGVVKAAESD